MFWIGFIVLGGFFGFGILKLFKYCKLSVSVEVKVVFNEGNVYNFDLFFWLVRFNFIVDVVEKVVFVVVNIEVMGWFVGFVFGFYFGFISVGFGFIVIEDGMVFINVYVVENVMNVSVKLKDGRYFSGIVIDIDLENDLVVVKFDFSNKVCGDFYIM